MNGQWSPNATKNFELNLVQGSLIWNSNVDFARLVSLVKKVYDLDDGETCLYRSDSGDTSDVVNLSSHKTADADD